MWEMYEVKQAGFKSHMDKHHPYRKTPRFRTIPQIMSNTAYIVRRTSLNFGFFFPFNRRISANISSAPIKGRVTKTKGFALQAP